MDTQRAVETYTWFRHASVEFQPKLTVAPYIQLPEPAEAFSRQHAYLSAADQHLLDVTNFINEYTVNLHHLRVWESLLEEVPEAELMNVLMEFVHPSAYVCLGFPHALKSRLHFSIALVSHLANEFKRQGWSFVPDLGKSKYETAREQANGWNSWPRLRGSMGKVNDRVFRRATCDFRNEHEHGFPRLLEFGVKPFVRRLQTDGGFGCAVGALPPLRLQDLLPPLLVQHAAALRVHGALVELLREQTDAVMAINLAHNGGGIGAQVAHNR